MNECLSRKLKTVSVISLGLILLLLLIRFIPHKEETKVTEEHTITTQTEETEAPEAGKQYSDLPTEDCQLCGHGKGTLLPAYRGQDNVGIISLNTFILTPIEINPYDDNGNPSVRPAQGSSTHI